MGLVAAESYVCIVEFPRRKVSRVEGLRKVGLLEMGNVESSQSALARLWPGNRTWAPPNFVSMAAMLPQPQQL
jgi:hypothetical protein